MECLDDRKSGSDESQHPSDDGIGLGVCQGGVLNHEAAQVNEYADDIVVLEQIANVVGVQIEVVIEELRPQGDIEDIGSESGGDAQDWGAWGLANAPDLVGVLTNNELDDESIVSRDDLREEESMIMNRIQVNVTEGTSEEACQNPNASLE